MKKLISTVLALGMAAGLTGCGSRAAATPGSTADAVSTESAAAAATDLAYMQGKGKMTIGYTVYEPMNYTDADGNFTGFDTELATAVCAKLGVEPDFVEINWDTKVVELDAKSIDCIWNGLTLTDDREENMACTKPYVKNAQVVVVKDGTEQIETGRKKVGAMLGDRVEVGCNSVLNPGTVIGPDSNVYPTSCVRGVIPAGHVYKDKDHIIAKK